MDKIEIGEWVRTNNGNVFKFDGYYEYGLIESMEDEKGILYGNQQKCCKIHSKNKIKLLEDGDFVELEYKSPKYRERITRVFEVSKLGTGCITFENRHCEFFIDERDKKIIDKICKNIKIKSILTHEEYNSRKYNFEEEKRCLDVIDVKK